MEDIEMGPYDPEAEMPLGPYASSQDMEEEKVQTSYGLITVGVVGDRKKPALLTFHDLGLNGNSCFQSFFLFSEMTPIAERFCIYHVNAPGQEEDASLLPENVPYPSLDELSQMLSSVTEHFKIHNFIGVGVGIGANILLRYAMKNPNQVDALILINCITSKCGWIEWAYQKMNVRYLTGRGMTTFTLDYLMWHHFGRNLDAYNPDLIQCYRQYFARLSNPGNLAAFIESAIRRVPLEISRDHNTIGCPVLQIVGSGSPFVSETVDLNSKLNPSKSDWLKVTSSGLVLEERPDKAAEGILLFLQGLGHFPSFNHLKWVERRRTSVELDSPPPRNESPQQPIINA